MNLQMFFFKCFLKLVSILASPAHQASAIRTIENNRNNRKQQDVCAALYWHVMSQIVVALFQTEWGF